MFPGLNLYYTDPAQHITTANTRHRLSAVGRDLSVDYLDRSREAPTIWVALLFLRVREIMKSDPDTFGVSTTEIPVNWWNFIPYHIIVLEILVRGLRNNPIPGTI